MFRRLRGGCSTNSSSRDWEETKQEFADVTVEVEDPVLVATLSVNEQSHGDRANTVATVYEKGAPAPLIQNSDPNNRRAQARYTCRLGAEVYLTGTSVPHHCCLTDLSSGGCYLEVSLPLPQASTVEILVRTYEMKLRLRGTVQSSHPGYGMGILFELNTKEQRGNVDKLIDFVAAQHS